LKIFNFSKRHGHPITHFDSQFIMSRIVMTESTTTIGCMHLEKDGVIGYHQAASDQLLLIMNGEGFVRTSNTDQTEVQAGHAIFWKAGEWHETVSEKGLTAIVIESEKIDPDRIFMNH